MNKGAYALLTMTILSGIVLMSNTTSATKSVSNASVSVPEACTMTGSGMNSHTATITPGTFSASSGSDYENGIGKTTFTVICNDYNGFAIYAIGYTGDSYDDTNHTKLVGSNTNAAIDTAVYSSGDTTSSWSMKVNKVTDSTISYLPTNMSIQNSFDSWHTIPDTYTKVAQYKASTGSSTTDTTLGAKIDTTYAAFIAPNQPGDTYVGQVKYVMIHPYNEGEPVYENQVGIIYEGNGLYFDQNETQTRNRVVYEERCEDEYGYIGDTPTILKTRNLSNDGTQNGPYSEPEGEFYEGNGLDPSYAEFEGASRLKLVIRYGLTQYDGYISFSVNGGSFEVRDVTNSSVDRSGTITTTVDGDEMSVYSELGSMQTNTGYDYGLYIQVYPVYDEPTEGATYGLIQNTCSYRSVVGTYAETTTWNNYWYDKDTGESFYDEDDIAEYLSTHSDLLGSSIHLYAANSYSIIFNANGGSGEMASQEAFPYRRTVIRNNTFTKPHQDVVSWNTRPDGTGTKIYASNDLYDGDKIYYPLANPGENVTLYAQWGDCMRNNNCYDDNGANSPITMYKTSSYGYDISYLAPNFIRQNYGFAGWNTKADGTGQNIGPTQKIGTPSVNWGTSTSDGGHRLYANWVLSTGNLQNWSGCAAFNIGDFTALTDNRDGDTYAVAKLADGKCWMIENLRLGGNDSITLSTSDTHTAGLLPANGASGVDYTNILSPVSSAARSDQKIYSYGNYYSWNVAVNTNQTPGSFTVINSSICPVGWHLPSYSEFQSLGTSLGSYTNDAQTSRTWRSFPNNFINSKSYWSSTEYSSSEAVGISIGNTSFNIISYVSKSSKRAVRCISNY